MVIRCFIAIELPDSVRKSIGNIIDNLRKSEADVKWVPYENIHITLKFLGNTDESLVTSIKNALCKKLLPYNPFYITIADIGSFPDVKRPRVIWVGIEDSELLKKMHGDINNVMVQFGYSADRKDFSPHVTVGRVRSQKKVSEMMRTLNKFSSLRFGQMEVNNISLMKSELKPAGAKYYRLAAIPFSGRHDVE